jgi:RND family efflux transporter MFP subunit
LTGARKGLFLFDVGQLKASLDDLRIERKREAESTSRVRGVILALLVLLLLGGVAAFVLLRAKGLEVRTAVAREGGGAGGGDRTVLNASGYVTARLEATVSSKVTGKVVLVLVEEGMKVEKNQVLARLDDTNVRASLRLAEAQLDSARNALAETLVRIKEADQELKRQSDLVQNKIATQADYDHAEAAALALKAKLEVQRTDIVVAERQLASWQQQLDDTIIRAPFSGIVTTKNAQPGEMISPLSVGGFTRTGICTIVDMHSLEIEIDVNESYINRVEPGQAVQATLDAYPDWQIPCKVIAIIPSADRQKSTVKVRVGFDKLDPRILPEMGTKVAFRQASVPGTSGARQIIIPKAAVRQLDGRDLVLVIQDGRAERRAVKISGMANDEVIVSAGLRAGETLALDWPVNLTDGAQVKVAKP